MYLFLVYFFLFKFYRLWTDSVMKQRCQVILWVTLWPLSSLCIFLNHIRHQHQQCTIISIDRSNHWLDNVLVTGVGTRLRADCCSPWIGECQRNIIVTCTVYCAVLCCVLRGGATETEISTGEQKLAPRWPVTGGRMWCVLLGTERNRKTMFSCYLINRFSVRNFQNRLLWKGQ